jgi:hypothetical protein
MWVLVHHELSVEFSAFLQGQTQRLNAEFAELKREYAEGSRIGLCVLFVFTLRTLRSNA